jgi:hypothetical protein
MPVCCGLNCGKVSFREAVRRSKHSKKIDLLKAHAPTSGHVHDHNSCISFFHSALG